MNGHIPVPNGKSQLNQGLTVEAHTLDNKVMFTRNQFAWLEKQFPELIGTPTTTNEQLRYSSGQRSVISAIRSRVSQ